MEAPSQAVAAGSTDGRTSDGTLAIVSALSSLFLPFLVVRLTGLRRTLSSLPSSSAAPPSVPDQKFAPREGLTFYYFPRSPCARRVWVTLLAKKIKVEMVMVDLMKGEQRNPAFLAINPQGKVPAIRCHNHATVPDCILYESQAIVEWLDEQFPDTPPLYPKSFHGRLEVKLWQYWELSMAEDMWPLSRQQVDGIIWRFTYSRDAFYRIGPPREASSDPFYASKVSKVYEGTYLSEADARRRALRVLRAFQMLEVALRDAKWGSGGAPNFLVGTTFTHADICAYPRLCKVPQNGLVSTAQERALFPCVCAYFEALRKKTVFSQFAAADDVIWRSGVYPQFVPQWWGKVLPWWFVVAVGNWRAGLTGDRSFVRVTQSTLGQEAIQRHLELVAHTPLAALPVAPLTTGSGSAQFRRELRDSFVSPDGAEYSEDDDGSTGPGEIKSDDGSTHGGIASTGHVTLYHHPALPLAVAARACLMLQSRAAFEAPPALRAARVTVNHEMVDVTRLAHLSPDFLRLMPMGEVPVLVHEQRVVYGPHIVVEYMDEVLFGEDSSSSSSSTASSSSSSSSSAAGAVKGVTFSANAEPSISSSELFCRLLPQAPIDRAVVRRWFGWCRTAHYYQIEPLYNTKVLPVRVRQNGCSDEAALYALASLQGVTHEEAAVFVEKCFPPAPTGSSGEEKSKETACLVAELQARIDTVEGELKSTSRENRGRSLLGHAHFTYADYFVLSIVMLAEVYSGKLVSADKHPFVYAWKQVLLQDASVAALFIELCRAHGSTVAQLLSGDAASASARAIASTPQMTAASLMPVSSVFANLIDPLGIFQKTSTK